MSITKNIQSVTIRKYSGVTSMDIEDAIVVEEPLEIRLSFGSVKQRKTESIYITMRTPGEDRFLAIGFLYTEDIIQSYEQVYKIDLLNSNVILVELKPEIPFDSAISQRIFASNSSCGICGKTSIASINNHRYVIQSHKKVFPSNLVYKLSEKISENQSIFKATGGLHSASLFGFDGNILAIYEDVGRHNALDKLIGFMVENGLNGKEDCIIFLSGRLGFELIHKTLKIGISVLIALGSPSSLSVEVARKNQLCLVGFVKDDKFNVYTHSDRIL